MKRSKVCEFPPKVREAIRKRDATCIFCRMGYKITNEAGGALQVMHYVGRAQGGKGVEENGALGCVYHHQMLDNGLYHNEMKAIFRGYLKSHYPKWDESALIYNKWKEAGSVIT